MNSIAIDIGGSHISSVAIDSESAGIIRESFFTTTLNTGERAQTIINSWCGTIQKTIWVAGNQTIKGLGIAMPGPFDYQHGISLIQGVNKYDRLMGLDVGMALKTQLELPDNVLITFINDAFAFGIGEAWKGVGKGAERVVVVTLGTGFGSAFLKNGIPVVKGEHVPEDGFIYHVPFKDSIAEDYVSTKWFLSAYYQLTGMQASGVKEIADQARQDSRIAGLFEEFGQNLAHVLVPWLKSFDSEILAIGGNLSLSGELFLPALKKNFREKGMSLDVKLSELNENATFIGCSRLAHPEFHQLVEKNLY